MRALAALVLAASLHVPHGYSASVFATGLVHPTAMAYGPDGRLYVTEDGGSVVSVARGGRPRVFATGLRVPLGLVWVGRSLYVSEQGRIEQIRGGRRRTVVAGLPYGRHQQDAIVFRDGRLWFGSGSTCDACTERDRRSAAVLSVRPDGSGLRVVARGLRNPYGLAFQPGTHRLYASVNSRDDLGDDEPAEMLVVVRQGRDFGWPACNPSYRRRRMEGACRGVVAPAAYLEPHSSADGIAFWRGDLYVAEWGEYAHHRHGRRIVRVHLGPMGAATRVTTFATGLPHPLALLPARDGGLLVADWEQGAVYELRR